MNPMPKPRKNARGCHPKGVIPFVSLTLLAGVVLPSRIVVSNCQQVTSPAALAACVVIYILYTVYWFQIAFYFLL